MPSGFGASSTSTAKVKHARGPLCRAHGNPSVPAFGTGVIDTVLTLSGGETGLSIVVAERSRSGAM